MKLPPTYDFRRSPTESAPPEPWRMVDLTVARWVTLHGGSPLLARLAGWASHADGHGDSALPLTGEAAGRHGMAPLDAGALAQLMAEPMVAVVDPLQASGRKESASTPFVIDDGHFYLRRNHLHETAIAQQIRQRRSVVRTDESVHQVDIDVLFQSNADQRVAAQRAAVAQVPGKRLFVLTGGPGTGKTTTVLRMLMLLIKRRAESGESPAVIRVSAPTGKAAQRLSESLRDGAALMREGSAALSVEWQSYLDATLEAQASTLHRLLGSRGHRGGFVHHAGNRLPADIVIVDEASMVDLAMLRNLLDALRDDAALILVGDADQLTSVGTGSVLLDLVGAMEGAGADDLVRLSHSFRAEQALVAVNEAVRAGDLKAFMTACDAASDQVSQWTISTAIDLRAGLARWAVGLARGLKAAGAFERVPSEVDGSPTQSAVLAALDGLRERQLLCGLREGEFGSEEANRQLEGLIRAAASDDGLAGGEGEWYPGRAVMITRNDYTAGLFNGDVGLCLRDAQGELGVWFEVAVSSESAFPGEGHNGVARARRGATRFSTAALPDHQGAYAITIHKSQGSEYRHVAVLLPPDPENRILSRQLLYTGISRARETVAIWAADAVVERAISTRARRWSGLRRKLETLTATADAAPAETGA